MLCPIFYMTYKIQSCHFYIYNFPKGKKSKAKKGKNGKTWVRKVWTKHFY